LDDGIVGMNVRERRRKRRRVADYSINNLNKRHLFGRLIIRTNVRAGGEEEQPTTASITLKDNTSLDNSYLG
jgi:hypothetical protein